MYNVIASGTKIVSKFGFGYFNINGLIVFTMKLRMKQHSIKHMALWYVLKVEENLELNTDWHLDKNGVMYVTYRNATIDNVQRERLFKVLSKAQGYVHQHMADEKLGTKSAPDFVSFYRTHHGFDNNSEILELPF